MFNIQNTMNFHKEPISPILGSAYIEDKHLKKVEHWWFSTKYDGVRGVFLQSTKKMYTRKQFEIKIPEFLRQQLSDIGLDLDGEIWFGNRTGSKASGLSRRHVPIDEEWKDVVFMVIDTPDPVLPFEERQRTITEHMKDVETPNVKKVRYVEFDPKKTSIAKELKKVEDAGGEGLVIRKPKSKYIFRRTAEMLKVKSWDYIEAEVVGYTEGTGKYEGMLGSLTMKSEEFGTFSLSGMLDAQRELEQVRPPLPTSKEFTDLLQRVRTSDGVEKYEALEQLNKLYPVTPIKGEKVVVKFKEETDTKEPKPKFPSFVGILL